MDTRPRQVPSWPDDFWEDWRSARSDTERRMMLQGFGIPPQLQAEADRLFPPQHLQLPTLANHASPRQRIRLNRHSIPA